MQKIINILKEAKQINDGYELPNDKIDRSFQEIVDAKVCVPVIGKFSAGKSALVNTILGYANYKLKTDITPETAVPTEIVYSQEEKVSIFFYDGSVQDYSIEDYKNLETDAAKVKSARLYLNNQFMREIPDVMLVDMPGFESGYEMHNKVIDDYLPQSLAYLIAIPADDMILRETIGTVLKELRLNNMPLCIAITKYDKRNEAEYDALLDKLRQSLKKYIGETAVELCVTSSFTGDAESVQDFLREIQKNSPQILENKFKPITLSILSETENYLTTALNKSALSQSQLLEEEEKLKNQSQEMDEGFGKEKQNFEIELKQCIGAMKSDVVSSVKASESTLVSMIMNKQDISEHLNSTIREELTSSVKSRLVPLVEKYISRLNRAVQTSDFGEVSICFSIEAEKIGMGLSNVIVSGVAGAAAFWAAGPIVGAIATVLALIVGLIQTEAKREEQKNKIRTELNSRLYPQIANEVGGRLELEVMKQINQIQATLDADIKSNRAAVEKALADLKARISEEAAGKAEYEANIELNLKRIEEMKNEL